MAEQEDPQPVGRSLRRGDFIQFRQHRLPVVGRSLRENTDRLFPEPEPGQSGFELPPVCVEFAEHRLVARLGEQQKRVVCGGKIRRHSRQQQCGQEP